MPHRRWPPRVPDIDAHAIRLRFAGTPHSFEQAFLELRGALDGHDCKPDVRTRYHIELVFEEIIGNMVRYGAPQGGELRIEMALDIRSDGITMTFKDDGIPFDPCGERDAVAPKTIAEARDGGFGLTIVRSVARSMRYERTADQNRLEVRLPAL